MGNDTYKNMLQDIKIEVITKGSKAKAENATEIKEIVGKQSTVNIQQSNAQTQNTTAEKLKQLGNLKTCKMGHVFFRQGEKGTSMYIILKGKVEIWAESNGNHKKLGILSDGDFFGEMSLLEGMPRSATALSVEDSIVMEIKEEHFKEFIQINPDTTYNIMKSLSKRIRKMNEKFGV